MCGIAGIYNFENNHAPEKSDLEKMIRMLRHRGPDDFGFHLGDQIGLAHARLSIIDLAGGHQPMHDIEQQISIVFNGEIFNYIELRELLAKRGVQFSTHGDTEVIIYLYKEFGLDFVHYLNGQFAIGLWDNYRKQLVLVRDRVGIDPLFYMLNQGKLLFASEIKSILAHPAARAATLNLGAFDQLLSFWTPVGAETIFEGVSEVKPGEMLIIRDKKIEHVQYWEWLYPIDNQAGYHSGNEADLATELHDRLIEATKIRLRSDVPVAAYLSGGLDSSVLVSIIHHYGNVPLRTFSIGFEDKSLDESSYQKQLIDHISADHSSIVCKHHDIAENFERTIWHTESTILRTAPVPMMLLSGLVHDSGYKVVLTGEGSDEVLGGYDLFKEGKIRQFWAKNSQSSIRPLLLKKLYPYLDISQSNSRAYLEAFFGIGLDNPEVAWFSHLPRWDTTSKVKAFYSDELNSRLKNNAMEAMTKSLDTRIDQWHSFNKAQFIEARMLMAKYLLSSQGDRMLMANAVEGRFPFLDHTVIEFANKLRPALKMKVLNEKYLLKKAMKKYLPGDILSRHKQPYRAPDIPSFFYQGAPAYVDELLSDTLIRQYGYFDAGKVNILCKKIRAGKATGYKDNMAFMAILSTQMWHRKFVENFNKSN